MKTTLTLLSIFLLFSCKTKKVIKTRTEENEISHNVIKKEEQNQIEKVEQKQETKKTQVSEQKKESQTDIIVDGKAEDGKPLEIYNIENGDTLQAIKVTGNAKVHVRAKASKSDEIKKENSTSGSINKLEQFSRNLVKEENLKKTGKQINQSAKHVTTVTGTFWSFGLVAVLGTVALIVIGLIIYFKKYRKK